MYCMYKYTRVIMSGLCFLLVKQYLYEKAPKHFKRSIQQK